MDFNRISVKDIAKHLHTIADKENINTEETALHLIAQKADGALRDALTIFDRIVSFTKDEVTYDYVVKNLNIIDYDQYFKICDHVYNKDEAEVLLAFDRLFLLGFDGLNLLNGLSEHFRNLLVSQLPQAISLLEIPESIKARYFEQSRKFNKSALISILNILNQYSLSIRDSKNNRLHTELALIKLCHVGDALNLAKELQDQKKKPELNPEKVQKIEIPLETKAEEPDLADRSNGERSILRGMNNLEKLKTMVENNHKDHQESGNTDETAPDEVFENDVVKVRKIWFDYLENELSGKSKSLYNSLKNCNPDFNKDGIIKLSLENEALNELFIKEKLKIIDHYADIHNVKGLRIYHEVREIANEEKSAYLVNPKEKYYYMAEKNPELENLQKELGLQPED